ncbi:hypothetical protein ABEB36_003649 [Hypothenemus hampei]|uniref:Uncharacterized protein n=1 Tax=Hypothenemus hampei TaxID=57062 RepID=A0ABD1F9W0_HYPHA
MGGAKTVLVKKQNLHHLTHSYTAQYSLSASGKLLPKVFLCMAEVANKFGPKVLERVNKLVKEYKNIQVTCSKSGKLTKILYKEFLDTVIKPYVKNDNFLLLIDSWGGKAKSPPGSNPKRQALQSIILLTGSPPLTVLSQRLDIMARFIF